MTVEQDLRETLQERAARVSPSPDGWTSITLRIDHRRQRARVVVFALAALLPVVAVGATLTAVRDGNGARPVDTAGPSLVPSTPETTGPAPAVGPTVTAAMPAATTVPRNPVPSASAAVVVGTTRIWPETRSELDEFQKGYDEGHSAWRGSPDGVAKVFLLSRALPDPKVDPTDHGASQVAVPYTAGGVGGTVHLARDREGGVYYVTANTTERITQVDVSREDNGLVLEIQSPTKGTVSARTKKPGGSWSTVNSQPIVPGGQSRMLVGVGQSGDLILQVRHEGDDGRVGIADQYVAAKAAVTPPGGAAPLGKGSKLAVDGIGPVKVGMTLGEAEGVAGVPMTRKVGPYCTELTPDAGPAGLAFVSTTGAGTVDVVTVSEPGVATLSGIGVGSTLADVDKAYPSAERRLTNDEGRLVYRADDPALAGFELVIGIGEGKVTQLWAGHKGLGMTDEICA